MVSTTSGQLIFRVKTREDTEKITVLLNEAEELKDKIKTKVLKRRRSRILILSVDPDVEDGVVLRTLDRIVDSVSSNSGGRSDIEITRKIKTRNSRTNFLLDVYMEVGNQLISKKRVCIDMERYRVVDFFLIIRCFRCQTFGHMPSRCSVKIK